MAKPLEEYKRKRDFRKTSEPRGAPAKREGRFYCIQKHAASHLHYDFRLELEGVLKSWAVPKGPSLDPDDRRLAMHVEDHPVEYGTFEGIIPAGEYGGGTVLLWDRGTWEPEGDPHALYRAGKLKFALHGEKLAGGYMLVRMGKPDARGKESWLLRKETDAEARKGGVPIVEARPESVASGRSLEEIAAAADSVWHSDRVKAAEALEQERLGAVPAAKAGATAGKVARGKRAAAGPSRAVPSRAAPSRAAPDAASLPGAKRAPLPAGEAIAAELATLVTQVPDGAGWIHEIKFDGYRILARLDRGRVTLWSRNGKDWTDRFGAIARGVASLPATRAILDGEVVVVAADGTTSFQALQNAFKGGRESDLVYYVFDLPYLDGHDLGAVPLLERKRALRSLVGEETGPVRYTDHVEGSGEEVFRAACGMALEGIVSKRADSPYTAGRGRDWVKTKCTHRQEFVVGGYTDPEGSRTGLGALLVGVHDGDGHLVYSGKVGTGYTDRTLADLTKRLAKLERKTSPFRDPPRGYKARGVHWVEPKLVVEVEFTEWTSDGHLRHPSFEGIRADKAPAEVVRERAVRPPSAAGSTAGPAAGPPDAPAASPRAKPSPAHRPARAAGPVEVEGVRLTHPERVLYPDLGLTKLDLARYYASIADRVLPYLVGRPLTLVRCPEGTSGPCFFQKHAIASTPAAIRRISLPERDGKAVGLVVDDLAGLLSTVQMGGLELHVWNSRVETLEKPDQFVIDLDPDEDVPWPRVVEAARLVGKRLADAGILPFVKTTGGKGLHVVAPLVPELGWDAVRDASQAVADAVVREEPGAFVATMTKAKRKGKIFLDYFRNTRGATAIAPYSTRARPGAPVATPLAWDELDRLPSASAYHVRNLGERLRALDEDPWAGFDAARVRLDASIRKALGAR